MIELINLSKKFGSFTAVNNINLEVEPGNIFAFLGTNGAGKTTTIRMMTGFFSLRPEPQELVATTFKRNL